MTIPPLTEGIKLGPYQLQKVYSLDRYSCVYLAFDRNTSQQVMIREFTPMGIAQRSSETHEIEPIPGHEKNYHEQLELFLQFYNDLIPLIHDTLVETLGIYRVLGGGIAIQKIAKGLLLPQYAKQQKNDINGECKHNMPQMIYALIHALRYLHTHDILHGNLTLETISIEVPKNICLHGIRCPFDFGMNENTTMLYNENLAAPETLLNMDKYDKRTEIYSLGACIYYMLTGQMLQRSDQRFYTNHQTNLMDDNQLKKSYSKQLLKSIDQSLQPIRENRFGSANEWLLNL